MDSFTVAVVQTDCQIGAPEHNLCRFLNRMDTAFRQGAKLMVFPEAALAGYCFGSLEEARPHTVVVPGPVTEQIAAKCRSTAAYVVMGLLEVDGDRIYNTAALIGPAGYIGKYRKIHLPYLGVDRFLSPGEEAPTVYDTPIGRIGILICYDLRFPEAVRSLALEGADIIALPTNWPIGAESNSEILVPARALENNVYVAACDRIGEERGYSFAGMSGVAGPNGKWEVCTQTASDQILYANVSPDKARAKHLVRIPGEWEIHVDNDRRPATYRRLFQT